jgi:hypothetical protein
MSMSKVPEYKPYDSAGNKYGEPRPNPDWNKPKSVNMPLSKLDLSSKGSSALPTTSDSEAEELLIFGLIVHYLGLPENANPDKYNALTKKMVSLMSQVEIEAAIAELQSLNRDIFGDLTTAREIKDTITVHVGKLYAQLKAVEGSENG